MEKISKGKHFDYPITTFTKDGFIEIINVLSENCKQYEVVIEDYKLNSISEFDEIPYKESVDFKLSGYDPYITIQGYYAFTQLYLSDIDSVNQQGIKVKIDKIFEKNRSIWAYFDKLYANFFVMILLPFVIFFIFTKDNIVGILLAIIFVATAACTFYLSLKKHTVLYLKKSAKTLTFWEKNGDLIIATLIATFTATLLVELILKFIL
jgi:hypothetical protein